MPWKPIVGQSFTATEFDQYCHTLKWDAWRPSFIVLHNTANPSLAQRPQGLTREHITNLEAYYRGQNWSAGPHLFVDDSKIWCFTPLTVSGIHSPSWNKIALGIEMLGNYEAGVRQRAWTPGPQQRRRRAGHAVRHPGPRSAGHEAAPRRPANDAPLPRQERAETGSRAGSAGPD